MTIFEKFESIENQVFDSSIKKLYQDNNMTILHSGGGCFHLVILDDHLCECDDNNVKNCICEKEWIINGLGDHYDNGGDCDLDFENKIELDTICITSTSHSDYFNYIDSFENIINRIKNGDLALRVKIENSNQDENSVFYTGDK